MAGVASDDSGAGGSCGSDQSGTQQLRCQAGEALAEWRSSEQVESGTPSTSPPYWDSDDDDDDGPKPSELYGKYTWKIEKFSQVNKRELRSSVFEVGSYKWYILIYPQGCDVCNHLSLFLCVSNHDKLLPGWSHLAQFTISVVHKDPKKSKYSDTLHRFWKKEHDWGWKKFIELPKVFDGFVENDSLVIKAQVQIIRERVDRPFRCLDCLYRRELIRVYLSNVQDKCRKFYEEKIKDLRKRIEDKARWTSLRAFWLGMDKSSKQLMSQGKAEPILKALVAQFFEHKEVVSTLIMDSLYSGMKAIDSPDKGKKSKGTYPEGEELPAPVICRENDTFVLVDDMLLLLARAALEPLPAKEEKGPQIPQNRTKEGASGEEFGRDSIERDERRLTESGRKTIEIFVFDHIFRKMDVALQEALSLKMQEELIREEEAACLADKEKKSKKKQSRQKKNHRKGKDKGRDEKKDRAVKESIAIQTELVHEKTKVVEDLSDVSDSIDCVPEVLPVDSEGRDAGPFDSDTNVSEVVDGIEGVSLSAADDSSSSTCSSDSVPPVVTSAPERMNSRRPHKEQKSPIQRNHQSGTTDTTDWVREEASQSSEVVPDVENFKVVEHPSSKASFRSSESRSVYRTENHVGNKDGVAGYRPRTSGSKDVSVDFSRNGKNSMTSSFSTPTKSIPSKIAPSKVNAAANPGMLKNPSSNAYKPVERSNSATNTPLSKPEAQKFSGPKQSDRPNSANNASPAPTKLEPQRITTPKPTENHSGPVKIEKPPVNPSGIVKNEKPSSPVMSRPLSAPLVVPTPKAAVSSGTVGPRPTPTLSRSVSATGRLGPEHSSIPSAAMPSYVPLSYRNAILGSSNLATGTSNIASGTSSTNTRISQNHSTSSSVINASAPPFLPKRATQPDSNSKFSFGVMSQQDMFTQSLLNNMEPFNLWSPVRNSGPQNLQVPAGTSGRQIGEDFAHLDIINDLLDNDDFSIGDVGATSNIGYQNFGDGPLDHLNRQFSYPADSNMLIRSMSACGFEGSRVYHDNEFQNGYISSGTPYDGLMMNDIILPEANSGVYMNGQLDGLIPNQWQMDGSELLYPGVGNMDLDGYPYQNLIAEEYQNPSHTIGANGYPVFRSANGI